MSDNKPTEVRESFSERAYAASPLGVAATFAGVVLAIVFLIRFHGILEHVGDKDLRAAIQALEITVVAVWIAVALWGWYLIRDGMERANTNRRLKAQASSLSRIESALADMDHEKEELSEKSRSFWNWRRGEST
jgi:hypothetical protein